MRLYPVVKECRRLEDIYNWGYKFKWDQGSFETALTITDDGQVVEPSFYDRTSKELQYIRFKNFVPDIMDRTKRVIIEYEEEARPNTGYQKAKKHKGHFQELENPRDTERNKYYKMAGFRLLQIYESDENWQKKLKDFLVECHIQSNPYHANPKKRK